MGWWGGLQSLKPVRAGLARMALGLALLALVLDQASKAWILTVLAAPPHSMAVIPLLNFDLVWNRGVTFGLLTNHHDWMPYVWSGVACLVVTIMLRWLCRVDYWLVAAAIGLIIGGAIGNVIDRCRFGAVVDFIHVAYYPWVFNVADCAVVVGVCLLVFDSFKPHRAA